MNKYDIYDGDKLIAESKTSKEILFSLFSTFCGSMQTSTRQLKLCG